MSDEDEREKAIRKAALNGLQILEADSFTLFLDCDSEAAFATAKAHLKILQLGNIVKCAEWCHSKSGNFHIRAKLTDPRDRITRVALQACCGSDPKHELLSAISDCNSSDLPILMFWTGKPWTPLELAPFTEMVSAVLK